MNHLRLPLTVTILVLGAAALAVSGTSAGLSSADSTAWLAAGGVLILLALLTALRRLTPEIAVAVALGIGWALFLRRVWIAPSESAEDLVSLQYLAFRGVTLLSGAAFIATGPVGGLVVSGVNLASCMVVLVIGPMGFDHPADTGTMALEVGLQAGIVILMFRILAVSVESLRARAETAQERAELAFRDELTDLPNRRQMSIHLRAAVARTREGGGPDTVIMFDLDHFKAINDTLGHDVGDRVLRRTAVIASATMRDGDVLARWGGEEFMALLTGTELAVGQEVAERCRLALEEMALEEMALEATGGRIPLTASFGVTTIRPEDTLTELLRRVDTALYEAKQSGRNQVVLVGADTPT